MEALDMKALYRNIGQRIQKLRLLNKLTQEELAEKLDLSVKHVSSVERGRSSLSLEKLIRICEVLDCTIDYLVLGREVPEAGCYIPRSILDILTRTDAEERELLQEYLQFFRKLHG